MFLGHLCMTDQMNWNEVKVIRGTNKCVVVIDRNVYDVTDFLKHHPGGDTVLVNAGKMRDASDSFFTFHDRSTLDSASKYLIGRLSNPEKTRNDSSTTIGGGVGGDKICTGAAQIHAVDHLLCLGFEAHNILCFIYINC